MCTEYTPCIHTRKQCRTFVAGAVHVLSFISSELVAFIYAVTYQTSLVPTPIPRFVVALITTQRPHELLPGKSKHKAMTVIHVTKYRYTLDDLWLTLCVTTASRTVYHRVETTCTLT